MKLFSRTAIVLLGLALVGYPSARVMADGTETLGPPGIAIAPGTGIVAGGIGLDGSQPGMISVDVPGDVQQALIYWQGVSHAEDGDDTIEVDGNLVTGTLIGGFTFIPGPNSYISCYRGEITDLVTPGANTLSIDGLAFSRTNDGAGVVVIYDDGSEASDIAIRDGCDFGYINSPDSPFYPPGTMQTTVPQTFTFAPAASDRMAQLTLFAGDVAANRPSLVKVTVDGSATEFWNLLVSADGNQWDTVRLSVDVPAGASSLVLEVISASDGSGNNPASLIWIAATLSVEREEDGGAAGCTPGFWKQAHHLQYWMGYSPDDLFDDIFGVDASGDLTLLETLWRGGGGEIALGRHAVAALLNAASGEVDYLYTEADVISFVQEAFATGEFESFKQMLELENERGCTVDKSRGSKKKR